MNRRRDTYLIQQVGEYGAIVIVGQLKPHWGYTPKRFSLWATLGWDEKTRAETPK